MLSGLTKRRIIIVFIALVTLAVGADALATDARLMKRPRQWYEYDPAYEPGHHDHNGMGWDWLYKGEHEKAKSEFMYCIEVNGLKYGIDKDNINRTVKGAIIGLMRLELIGRTQRGLALSYLRRLLAAFPKDKWLEDISRRYIDSFKDSSGLPGKQ